MKQTEFVAEFIQTCLNQGINKPVEMREKAENEISKIDDKFRELDKLKIRQNNLRAVVRNLGGGTSRKRAEPASWNWSLAEEKLDTNQRKLLAAVCRKVEKANAGLSTSAIVEDIYHEFRLPPEERNRAYGAIKWLGARGIIERDESRLVIVGKNWNARPGNEN